MKTTARIGVVGTGFISRGFTMAMEDQSDFTISHVLTRSQISNRADFSCQDLLANSIRIE